MRFFSVLLAGTLAATASSCWPYFWQNFSGTQKVSPQYMAEPKSAAELVQAGTLATHNGKRIRMTGSGHSHSDVAVTDEVLLTPKQLVHTLTLDHDRLKK